MPHSTMQAPSTISAIAQIEADHRIANNLALLAVMMEVDSHEILDPRALGIIRSARRRIHAIAGVHRQLCNSRLVGQVDLAEFLSELAEELGSICQDSDARRRLMVVADKVFVTAKDARLVGILVAELVGNACKHAYAAEVAGDVRIGLAARGKTWRLSVEDDGAGRSASTGTGVGSYVIDASVRDLGGRFEWQDLAPGTRFVLWRGENDDGLVGAAPSLENRLS